MRLSQTLLLAVILAFSTNAIPTDVWAKENTCRRCQFKQYKARSGEQCPLKEYGCDKKGRRGGKNQKDGLEKRFFSQSGFFLSYKNEIGFADPQIQKITDLKSATTKELIMNTAETEVITLDIKKHLEEKKIDTTAVNALIDKKYELKKLRAKTLVSAYAQLKDIPTEQQKTKAKDIWQERSNGAKDKGK